MNMPGVNGSLPPQEEDAVLLPWSITDTWIGFALLVVIQAAILAARSIFGTQNIYGTYLTVFLELAYLLPVVIILSVRRANWKLLGFKKFDLNSMALGCGLLVASYVITLVNNLAFRALGQKIQSDVMIRIIESLHSPFWLVFTAVIVAPLVEESFFRGLLFAGFRQTYSWNRAALLSSLFFAVAHVELAAIIPIFILGYIFSYLYQRTGSIWPGIILHFLVNAFGMLAVFAYLHSGQITPL